MPDYTELIKQLEEDLKNINRAIEELMIRKYRQQGALALAHRLATEQQPEPDLPISP